MEQRLIDANKLVRRLKAEKSYANPLDYDTRSIYEDCIGIVSAMETVDAEPVVRCKDCEHYRNGICEKIERIMDGYYHGTFDVKRPDDFCSYGVKKSGGGENAAD